MPPATSIARSVASLAARRVRYRFDSSAWHAMQYRCPGLSLGSPHPEQRALTAHRPGLGGSSAGSQWPEFENFALGLVAKGCDDEADRLHDLTGLCQADGLENTLGAVLLGPFADD
jgi:hypothetical protein